MKRRDFILQSFTSSVGFIILPVLAGAAPMGEVVKRGAGAGGLDAAAFKDPPSSARPYTYWMWMNGNITKEGITLDLETMHRGGIGGAYIYNNAVGIPRGPVDYNSEGWKEMIQHAVREAERLGLVLSIHNSPGYSGTGGPWITPELSMQQLVWTERVISGGEKRVFLHRPYAKLGYYRDAAVLAYPALPGEKVSMRDALIKVLANGKEIDKDLIAGVDLDKKIRIEPRSSHGAEPGGSHEPAILELQFARPFAARAITVHRHPETPKDLYDGPRDYPPVFRLESSEDGINYRPVCTLRCPALRAMDAPAAASFDLVTATHFRLLTESPTYFARIELHTGPRLKDWPAKTNYAAGNTELSATVDGYEASLAIAGEKVIDLTDKLDKEGWLNWTPPAGDWMVLRIGHTTTGEVVGAAPDAGIGLECDKFSREAVDFHFTTFLDPLLDRLAPLVGKTLKSLLIDSWEAGKQNWTVRFPEEFRRRRGYDLLSLMPALTGRIVDSPERTEQFLKDLRQTHADLVAENYYAHFAECCHHRGLQLHGEPYGDGTFDSLQSGAHLDLPMGEFWTRYIYGDAMTSRQAVSLAHGYDRPIAASEAFTGMPITSRWTEYPYSLKAEADWFFTLGLNRLVFHTFVHQPHTTGLPGMTMGPFGTHFDRNSTWTPQLSCWTDYLSRVQYFLQQKGRVVVDICFFKGEGSASGIPDRRQIRPIVPKGYALDVIGPDVLLHRMRAENGLIVLPGGMSYRVLMLTTLSGLSAPVLEKIRQLETAGIPVIVSDRGENRSFEAQVSTIRLREDFFYTAEKGDAAIHFIHKELEGGDLYFITNHLRRKEKIVASFRTAGKQPELWDAETGSSWFAPVYDMQNERTVLPLELSASGSIFVLFRRKPAHPPFQELRWNDQLLFGVSPYPSDPAHYNDYQNNFTILLWIKPDTFAHRGKGFLFHAPEGEKLYGKGHAAMGLAAGNNVIRVYERSSGPAREIFAVEGGLEGWTAVALVCRMGRPLLYINGERVKEGSASGLIVHPGLAAEPSEEQYQSYFEGNSSQPVVVKEALSDEQVMQWFGEGIPDPEGPSPVELKEGGTGRISALIWENGNYSLHGKAGTSRFSVAGDCHSIPMKGIWELTFPDGYGAPASLQLKDLISLHRHPEFGVKHFSGTVIYRTKAVVPEKKGAIRYFLDLGRVEVLAEVRVNGQVIGTVWKEPYRIEITTAVRSGANDLEIHVTNLWPNRLIGDEQLPEEDQYSAFGPVLSLPDWYVNNQKKPGQRISFSAWHSYRKNEPLLASGLLGPVKVLTAVEQILNVRS